MIKTICDKCKKEIPKTIIIDNHFLPVACELTHPKVEFTGGRCYQIDLCIECGEDLLKDVKAWLKKG